VKKNAGALALLMIAGMVICGLLGESLGQYPFWSWLSKGMEFGIPDPAVLDIGIASLTFGFTLQINVASVGGIALGILVYKRM
jgi:hypothetical protein